MALLIGQGSATLNFGFTQYSTKADIINAINNLPIISGSQYYAGEAANKILNDVLQGCPLRTNSQCTAMMLYADIPNDGKAADEVVC